MIARTPPEGQLPGGSADDAAVIVGSVEDASELVAQRVFEQVRARPWFRRLVQLGWLAKGVVYGSLGWAAIEISIAKSAPDEAEYTGIVTALADGSFTRILLGVIALGLVFYILFRLVSIALIDEVDLNAWAHRGAYLLSALTYVTIAWASAAAAIGGSTDDGESSVERLSLRLLESDAGRFALAAGGIVALGVAAYFIRKGIVRSFMSQIDDTELGSREHAFIESAGAIGWVGRGATVAIVAGFVTWSAIDADPGDVRGIDSSMHRVANGAIGQAVVMAVGCGLLVYAAYCIVSARRRRLAWDDNPEPAQPAVGRLVA